MGRILAQVQTAAERGTDTQEKKNMKKRQIREHQTERNKRAYIRKKGICNGVPGPPKIVTNPAAPVCDVD